MADQGAGGVFSTTVISPATDPDLYGYNNNSNSTAANQPKTKVKNSNMTAEDGPSNANPAANALPKCFCNWKHCRSYQKTFREFKHPIFNGVVKLKFLRDEEKSMALKTAVERCLSVDSMKRNEWRMEAGVEQCRYYIARHHFTEALMERYLADRRSWDWSEPLEYKDAKTFLWSLDKENRFRPSGDEDSESEEEEESDESDSEEEDESDVGRRHRYLYVQAPNVPKDHVRDTLRRLKQQREDPAAAPAPSKAKTSSKKKNQQQATAAGGPGSQGAASVHTQSTLSTSVTDTLKAFEDIIGHGEPMNKAADPSVELLAKKEEENLRLRQELNDCQEQLSMLHNMVRQLKDDMDRNRAAPPAPAPQPAPAPAPAKASGRRKKGDKNRENRVQRSNSNGSDPKNFPQEIQLTEDEEDEDWSEQNGVQEQEDDEEEVEEEEWSHQGGHSDEDEEDDGDDGDDDDETISTFHVTYNSNRSSHSRHGSRHSVRRGSVHSRRHSIHSRRGSRRDSIHSRRSIRGGMDDAASVHSRASIQSVSPSIKSLPREIQLMEEEEQNQKNRGDDDCSFFDDSYRKTDDDARSVGSRSAASRASRRSIVRDARGRGRNSRVGRGQKKKGNRQNAGNSVPREIDLSGDELEDETYANVSTDTSFVTERNIVDPYGEKGVYTGALSKSTGMPNGKGRLEYEKEGRWYEGDWIHGRWTGYGRLSNGDGDFYEGGLKNDHKHGTGVMKFADGRVFEGEYIRGQMIQGKMTYQDGSIYGGSWVDGMRHGRGKCLFVDGSEYEGEFREGNFHGHGKMTWNDGGWYVGEWCDGEMHGKGKEIRPDGSLRHDGEWSRGQPIRSANDSQQHRRRRNNNSNNGVEVS